MGLTMILTKDIGITCWYESCTITRENYLVFCIEEDKPAGKVSRVI